MRSGTTSRSKYAGGNSPAAVSSTITTSAPASSCCAMLARNERHHPRGELAIELPRRLRHSHRAGVRALHRVHEQRPRAADKPDQALVRRQQAARQRDRFGLKAQPRQGLVERSEARDAIVVERAIELRRAIVIRQRHAQRFERKQQIAEQDRGVEIEIARSAPSPLRPRAPARGTAPRSCAAGAAPGTAGDTGRPGASARSAARLRLAGQRALKRRSLLRLRRPLISNTPAPIECSCPSSSPSAWRSRTIALSTARCVGNSIFAPDAIENLRRDDDARRRLDQHPEHAAVAHLQERRARRRAIDRHRIPVDRRVPTCSEPPRRLRGQHVAHAQHELLQVKRLRQVLVGAELESGRAGSRRS